MTRSKNEWQGLETELALWTRPQMGRQNDSVSMDATIRFLGGYDGPRWIKDRRPQPLRSRRMVQHIRTIIRRAAVTRLKLNDTSYRTFGRELGISHVAAWKLWQQMVNNVCARALAESVRWKRLSGACALLDAGDSSEFRVMWKQAAHRFGVKRTSQLLGRGD